jgi:hypothetical protein
LRKKILILKTNNLFLMAKKTKSIPTRNITNIRQVATEALRALFRALREVDIVDRERYITLAVNLLTPILNDPAVRKAFELAYPNLDIYSKHVNIELPHERDPRDFLSKCIDVYNQSRDNPQTLEDYERGVKTLIHCGMFLASAIRNVSARLTSTEEGVLSEEGGEEVLGVGEEEILEE